MEDLVGRLKRGEAEAWREVIVEHYSTVYRFCARRVGLDAAQDATQEAFITIQKKMKSFEEKSSLLTWMMGIAHNHCRNLSRRTRDDVLWLRPEAEVASCENEVINQEVLRSALATLSIEHREVILMHEVEGYSYQEVASILGIPTGTVKSRLHCAFQNLRDFLGAKA